MVNTSFIHSVIHVDIHVDNVDKQTVPLALLKFFTHTNRNFNFTTRCKNKHLMHQMRMQRFADKCITPFMKR
jgi:hypothetical protein